MWKITILQFLLYKTASVESERACLQKKVRNLKTKAEKCIIKLKKREGKNSTFFLEICFTRNMLAHISTQDIVDELENAAAAAREQGSNFVLYKREFFTQEFISWHEREQKLVYIALTLVKYINAATTMCMK